MSYRQDLHDLIEPAVNAVDLQLLGLELVTQGKHSVLRVYIDHPEGIKVEDCEKASQQVSALLDIEDPISHEYTLEVSSPGIERPLFFKAHYEQALGEIVRIKTLIKINGTRKFNGIIEKIEDDTVLLKCNDENIEIPFAEVAKANLIIQ